MQKHIFYECWPDGTSERLAMDYIENREIYLYQTPQEAEASNNGEALFRVTIIVEAL